MKSFNTAQQTPFSIRILFSLIEIENCYSFGSFANKSSAPEIMSLDSPSPCYRARGKEKLYYYGQRTTNDYDLPRNKIPISWTCRIQFPGRSSTERIKINFQFININDGRFQSICALLIDF